MMTNASTFHPTEQVRDRGRHADFKLRVDDQSSVESDHGHGTDRLDKPRQSQPEGGMRFTSQTGRRHDGTLDQLASSPAHLIQVGGSIRPSARTVYASRQVRMHQSHLSAVRRHLSESRFPAVYNGIEPDASFEALADLLDRALGKRSDIKVLA